MKVPFIVVAGGLLALACTKADTRTLPEPTTSASGAMAPSGSAAGTGPSMGMGTGMHLAAEQGSSVAEKEITATIHQGILADEALKGTGQDVKVVTAGTKVTLLGPVNSGQARLAIAAIATRTAGVTEVDNQLQVVN
jgi:osmotically-inducible protein OsmY